MKKIDLKKELKYLYAPSAKKVEVVDVPEFKFVMIDGMIGPGETPETSQAFQDAGVPQLRLTRLWFGTRLDTPEHLC